MERIVHADMKNNFPTNLWILGFDNSGYTIEQYFTIWNIDEKLVHTYYTTKYEYYRYVLNFIRFINYIQNKINNILHTMLTYTYNIIHICYKNNNT